jgi:hypothetical protein
VRTFDSASTINVTTPSALYFCRASRLKIDDGRVNEFQSHLDVVAIDLDRTIWERKLKRPKVK